ncbi:MAG: hypothetical protein JW956_13400 [Calditrichaceae bacterium]|nr:hypothetical protein [Calditrichaceae bacterium]
MDSALMRNDKQNRDDRSFLVQHLLFAWKGYSESDHGNMRFTKRIRPNRLHISTLIYSEEIELT